MRRIGDRKSNNHRQRHSFAYKLNTPLTTTIFSTTITYASGVRVFGRAPRAERQQKSFEKCRVVIELSLQWISCFSSHGSRSLALALRVAHARPNDTSRRAGANVLVRLALAHRVALVRQTAVIDTTSRLRRRTTRQRRQPRRRRISSQLFCPPSQHRLSRRCQQLLHQSTALTVHRRMEPQQRPFLRTAGAFRNACDLVPHARRFLRSASSGADMYSYGAASGGGGGYGASAYGNGASSGGG
jgi:hypothetical protein